MAPTDFSYKISRRNGTGGCDIHLSDVIEVIENNDPSFNKITEDGSGNNPDKSKMSNAYVEIVEQPASKAMRFRYECEGRSAGSIPGQNSTPENKTFPTIRVVGYEGKAVVVVSCVTKDKPYKPHPHNLVGKEGCKKGVCTIEIPPDTMTVTFSNLGIRCVKKRDIEAALQVREEIRVDPFRTGFAHRNQASSIDLNAVRLCFQVFLCNDGKSFTIPLPPVVSEPIFDKKAMSDLAIFELSTDHSSVAGGQKVLLFCEKVTKDDINVRFYEEKNGQTVWEGFADFQPSNVHRQVGIAFTTPKYQSLEVTEPVSVFIQLFRPSDRACSEPLKFFYTPLESGRPSYWSLRRPYTKRGTSALNEIFNSILAADNKKIANENNLVEIVPNIVDQDDEEKPDNLINDPNLNDDSIQIGDQWKSLKEIENENIIENWNNISDSPLENIEPNNNNEEKSLNDLLNQVAELDEIYSESQARLLDNNPMETDANHNTQNLIKNTNPMELDNEFDDTNTYSSLQLAFKNPIDMLDKFEENIITAQSPVIEIVAQKRENDSEKLPPLPPKRVKKLETPLGRPLSQTIYSSSNSITLSTQQAQSILGSSSSLIVRKPVSRSASFNVVRTKPEYLAPQKNLPPTPNHNISTTTLPNPKKKGFFTKLFSRRGSKEKSVSRTKINTNNSNLNTPNRGSVASFKSLRDSSNANISLSGGHMKTLSPSSKDTPDVIHISLKGPLNSNPDSPGVNDTLSEPKTPTSDQLNLDLTEAEHYALYTAVAPHATQSEFDETSCYYAPVEGEADMKRKRQRSGSDTPNNYTRAQTLQNNPKNTLPPYGSMNIPVKVEKTEPREQVYKTYGGSFSPASPSTSTLDAMQYRNTLSVSPGISMSPAVNDMPYYNIAYQSPHNPNIMLSPSSDSYVDSTPSNSNDGFNRSPQWSMPTTSNQNVFSNKIAQMNITETQTNTQQQQLFFTQPNNNEWSDYGPNTHNQNDVTMKSADNTGAATNIFDLDSQELRATVGDLNNLENLNSTDLATLTALDPNQLSDTLSNNLTLDNNNRTVEDNSVENMTDSGLVRLANSTYNEICNINEIFHPQN